MLLLALWAHLGRLSSSDCHPAGPAGPYVAGGPVGPDESLKVLEPLEHSVLDHADPAGQHAVVRVGAGAVRAFSSGHCPGWSTYGGDHSSGTARAFGSGDDSGRWTFGRDVRLGTVSIFGSKCYPGRSTYGGDTRSGTVRAFGSGDGPGQWIHGGMSHLEPLEHSVLDAALVTRPMEETPVLEPLAHSVLAMTLDDGPLDKMSDWEPLARSVSNVTLEVDLWRGYPIWNR